MNEKRKDDSHGRYGLKASKCLKQVKELIPFKNDLIGMLNAIKFCKVRKQFLTKLNNDIKTANKSNETLTFADKTSNMY